MNNLLRSSKVFIKRNSSSILTFIGAAGVVLTSVSAVKATPKAISLLHDAKIEKGDNLTKIEKIKIAGPAYIPSILIGLVIAVFYGDLCMLILKNLVLVI